MHQGAAQPMRIGSRRVQSAADRERDPERPAYAGNDRRVEPPVWIGEGRRRVPKDHGEFIAAAKHFPLAIGPGKRGQIGVSAPMRAKIDSLCSPVPYLLGAE